MEITQDVSTAMRQSLDWVHRNEQRFLCFRFWTNEEQLFRENSLKAGNSFENEINLRNVSHSVFFI